MPAALGERLSLTGRRWSLTPIDERLAAALAQHHGLPEIVARVLAARGVGLGEVESFLAPKLRDLLPDPCRLKDMRAGAERLAAAITGGERIAVFGDYDVDGATAAALLLRFLSALGAPARLYVPDRLREGYGPNAPALLELRRQGVSLVVTVDCGIAAHDPLAAAAAAGLDVIVVDHHLGRESLPPAIAVINPKRLDDTGGLEHLAAVGVAFLLAVDVNRLLRQAGWYAGRAEPDLRQWLDLVALGTVCDMVPLCGVNRAFVAQGLAIMARRGNAGLRAIGDVAGLAGPPGARDLGFAIGPRINAGGRVGQADLGARLLATDDPDEAVLLARRLDALNRERQAIEQAVMNGALAQLGDGGPYPLLWAAAEGWHPGVVGIVASRLVERFRRPAVVIGLDGWPRRRFRPVGARLRPGKRRQRRRSGRIADQGRRPRDGRRLHRHRISPRRAVRLPGRTPRHRRGDRGSAGRARHRRRAVAPRRRGVAGERACSTRAVRAGTSGTAVRRRGRSSRPRAAGWPATSLLQADRRRGCALAGDRLPLCRLAARPRPRRPRRHGAASRRPAADARHDRELQFVIDDAASALG